MYLGVPDKMKYKNNPILTITLMAWIVAAPHSAYAQNRVVVVPLDASPGIVPNQFRIVPEPDAEGDGLQASDGRLEIRIGHQFDLKANDYIYGTVCDDIFDDNNNAANAICQDLGYSGGVLRDSNDITDGAAESPIALDNIECPNGATSFSQCTSNRLLEHNCDHEEDVGVTCF